MSAAAWANAATRRGRAGNATVVGEIGWFGLTARGMAVVSGWFAAAVASVGAGSSTVAAVVSVGAGWSSAAAVASVDAGWFTVATIVSVSYRRILVTA